jgi:hypothetical protein
METLRHEANPEIGCRVQTEHQAGIETGEATPPPLQQQEVQGDWRGDQEAP